MPKVKINITVDEDLLERIDQYAKENYISRSGLITLACTNYIIKMDGWADLPKNVMPPADSTP